MHNVGKSENPPWCQSVMKNKKLEPIILGPSTHIQVLEDCAVKKKKKNSLSFLSQQNLQSPELNSNPLHF